MDSLLKFVVTVNQAVQARKTVCLVSASRLTKQVSFFLRDQGYFSAVALTSEGLLLSFRYSNSITPFRKLSLISRPSCAVYFRANRVVYGVFVVSSSDSALSLKKSNTSTSGKALLQIL